MLIHDNRITKRISKAKIQSLESWSHLGYIGFNSRLLTAWEQLVVEHGGRSNVGRGDAKRASRDSRRSRVLASSRSFPPLSLDRNSDWIYNFLRVRDEDATRINVLCLTYPRGPTFRQSVPESRMTLRTYVRRMWIVCIITILVHFGLHETKMRKPNRKFRLRSTLNQSFQRRAT